MKGFIKMLSAEAVLWLLMTGVVHSADERFEATFRPDIVVYSSGKCSYFAPGKSHGLIWSDVKMIFSEQMLFVLGKH